MRLALGFASGTLGTSTGVSGPPLALWLMRRGLTAGELRDSLGATFLGMSVVNAALLAPVIVAADIEVDWTVLGAALACVILGHAVGHRVFAALSAARFQPLVIAMIVVSGAASVIAGAAALS